MTLKSAALFAFVAMALMTIVLTIIFIRNLSGMIDGFIPDITFLTSLIEWLAALSLLVFFAVFHRTQ